MRVAIICHFSNPIIRERLDLYPSSRYYQYRDFANWVTNIINGLKNRPEVELHVMAPHTGMRRNIQEFELEGVHYYFFRKELPFPFGSIEAHFSPQEKRDYPRNRKYVKNYIKKIQPDLVNLIGAENAYYAISALDVDNVPIMIHLQTVYANPERIKKGKIDQKRWDVELQLFHKTPYMACNGRMYYDLVKCYNPDAIVFPRRWPVPKFPEIPKVPKKYDFVFFAKILNKNKGFDNAIEAIGKFVKLHPEALFLAVGAMDVMWPQYEKRIQEMGLDKNLEIHPPFPNYIDLLQYVRQSRFALLPITMDVISGTIIEAMRMGMPVVTCRTSGTPSLNVKRETVLISDIGDTEGLCQNMLKLYERPELQKQLQENSALYLKEEDEKDAHNIDIMTAQYQAVIEHYRNGTPIPIELLYNIEENKDYR